MLTVFMLLSLSLWVYGHLTPEKSQQIDYYVHKVMAEEKIPGLSLAVVQDKHEVTAKGYGVADVKKELPVTEKTLFPVASLTKGMTATLAVKYFRDHNLSLDKPLHSIAPDVFVLPDRYRTEHVNMRDLLSHRSCLVADNFAGALGGSPSREDFVWRMRYYEEACPFRTKWVYSNMMYTLAGHILEKHSGVPWEEMLRDIILTPLQMNDTMFTEDVVDQFEEMDISKSYWSRERTMKTTDHELFRPVKIIAPAAGVVTNAVDMGKWISFHLTNGLGPNGVRVMEKEILDTIKETNMFIVSGKSYAMGFMDIGNINGYHTLMHDGFYPMYTSLLSLSHDAGIGVFTSGNGVNIITTKLRDLHVNIIHALTDSSDMPETFLRMSGGKDDAQTELPTRLSIPWRSCRRHFRRTAVNLKYEGNYGNLLYGNISVYMQEEDLYMKYGVLGEANLRSTDFPTRFDVRWTYDLAPLLEEATTNYHVEFGSTNNSSVIDTLYLVLEDNGSEGCKEEKRILFQLDLKQEDAPLLPYDSESC